MTTLRYVGVDRDGNARTGSSEKQSAAEIAQHRFEQGWQSLVITDGLHGQVEPSPTVVGEICSRDGRRIWWGEK